MKAIFLGTGTSQGVPVIGCDCAVCRSDDPRDQRLRTSFYVQCSGKHLVIDAGPDFRQQVLRARIPTLDALLLTHQHQDHVAGLDDVRPFNYLQDKPTQIYATPPVIARLRTAFAYAFEADPYPGAPRLEVHPIDEQPFVAAGLDVTPVPVMHGQMPVMGFRLGDLSYVTDVSAISAASMKKLEGSRVLVLSALRRHPHHSHFSLEQALAVIAKLSPEQAFLTHISHQMGLHAEVNRELPPNVRLAYDGLTIDKI
ncbi:MAG: MBL fold metallo-hydrolase [Bernardetiaceae bacterium]